MEPAIVRIKILAALEAFVGANQLKGKGTFLLTHDANERSLSHHFANCLEPLFSGWDIDCEYNRDGISDDPKELRLPSRDEPKSNDVDARTVFPDIIVHHRGGQGSAHNLLVIEIKKSSNKIKKEYEYDEAKLRAFRNQLFYQNAYLLKLNTDGSMENAWDLMSY